ncbi:MAG: regulator of protease activity HflC (stomatin/prohibitin superfamily) [Planctomycetota bacterium]|jgi:regulator of protease activity HflC (stomatin/prohibitin superfamily)
MAHISNYPILRHLRSEPSRYIIQFTRGDVKRSGKGLSFWFHPLSTSIAEVPCDDREQAFMFHGRSSDYQDVSVQGVLTYRVIDPEALVDRIDFSIDPGLGSYVENPLEQLAETLTRRAQRHAYGALVQRGVRDLLAEGVDPIRELIEAALTESKDLRDMGIEVVSVSVSSVAPTTDLVRALEAPALEDIQQLADEATFQRRAMAVEKERAIRENELQSDIELAVREENLITQRGQNEMRRVEDETKAARVEAEGAAGRAKVESAARAEGIRSVEAAKVGAERERIDVYRDLPPHVLAGLAAREFASKLTHIEHLNLTPDLLGPLFGDLMQAGASYLSDAKTKPNPHLE